MACVRRAWLVLGGQTIDLENTAAGYFCSDLDLGYPDVRDVMSNKPDQDGADDRTQYFGSRVVTAQITALAGAGAQIDAVASAFAPYMVPSVRPVLHYILDRPGAAERVLTLRASGYSWPIAGAYQRDIQLQWVAADPVVKDPTTNTVIAWAGSTTGGGRTYDFTPSRIYPPGGGGQIQGLIIPHGDLAVKPLLRIYGPITTPTVWIEPNLAGYPTGPLYFVQGFRIDAGHYVEIHTGNKTAYLDGDPTQSVLSSLSWLGSVWPLVPVSPAVTRLNLNGDSGTTSGVTQVQASWQDRYLT